MAAAPASVLMLPLSSSSSPLSRRSSATDKGAVSREQQQQHRERRRLVQKPGWFTGKIARVVRQDREFLRKTLEPAGPPLRFLHGRLSKVLSDIFWLRFLEEEEKEEEEDARPHPPRSWPKPSYAGLSGMDLLMADVEAMKLYYNYLLHISKVWSVPLPKLYDPQKVADYFNCRPHVIAVRVLEVFSSFASATIKMQTSRSFNFGRYGTDRDVSREVSQYYVGQLLKESMLNLGPTFVKVGQSLSTRPDIIGPEISEALSELHDKVPPFPRSVAMKIIEAELGCSVEDAFSYISEETVAAASFGQVYRGCTLDGCSVAIKVQRPDLLHAVVRDIYILRLGLGILRKIAKRKSDPRLYADELGKGLVGELDYTLEAANAIEFREVHSHYPFISVPKVFRHLSRKKVLTMEWLVGENPNELLSLSRRLGDDGVGHLQKQQLDAKKHVLDLVNKGVEASLVQLLETGLLHADPHPGNLRYTPEGHIGFLDFGLLCRMEKKHQLAMLASIVHIVNGDWGALVQDLTEMDVVPPKTNFRRVTMDLEEALGEVAFKDGIPDMKFSRVLGKIWSIALEYHFRMPPYYTLVLRSLASLEGLAVAADQDFKTFQAAYPYVVKKLLYDNSAATRRILYSVVFNKRREFQWQKLSLFLKIGSARKGIHGKSPGYNANGQSSVFDVADLILRLLPSKDGVVLRRLLMNVDAASLTRAMVSDEAGFFRQHVSRALGDLIYQWMTGGLGGGENTQLEREPGHERSSSAPVVLTAMRDRRLRVIFYNVLSAVRSNPTLMFRLCWTSLTVFVSASALAVHRLLVSWSEKYITSSPAPVVPRQFAVSRV